MGRPRPIEEYASWIASGGRRAVDVPESGNIVVEQDRGNG
jgi:hypothetical protein